MGEGGGVGGGGGGGGGWRGEGGGGGRGVGRKAAVGGAWQPAHAQGDLAGKATRRTDGNAVARPAAWQHRLIGGRSGDREIRQRIDKPVEDICGRLLDARVDDIVSVEVVQRIAPAEHSGGEHPGAARRLVDGCVGVIRGIVGGRKGRARQQGVRAAHHVRRRVLAK